MVSTVLLAFGAFAAFRVLRDGHAFDMVLRARAILAPTDAVAVEGLLKRCISQHRSDPWSPAKRCSTTGRGHRLLRRAGAAATQGQTGVVGHGHIALSLLVEGTAGGALGAATGYVASRDAAHRGP